MSSTLRTWRGRVIERIVRWLGQPAGGHLGLTATRQSGQPADCPSSSRGTILVIALDGAQHRTLAGQLEQCGHRAQVVSEKGAALDLLGSTEPILLIVVGPADLDLYRSLRRTSTAPILALAPQADEEHMLAAFAAGVDQYQVRPISSQEVAARAQSLLRRGPSGR